MHMDPTLPHQISPPLFTRPSLYLPFVLFFDLYYFLQPSFPVKAFPPVQLQVSVEKGAQAKLAHTLRPVLGSLCSGTQVT